MELCGITPPKMDWDSTNLPEAFKKFEQHIKLVFSGPLKAKEEEEQVSYVLLWVGERGRDIYNTFKPPEGDDAKKVQPYLDLFRKYVQPKLNPIFGRYKFNNEIQGSKTFDQFVTQLKLLARDCSFTEEQRDEMIRDRVVFGVSSEKVREKLINVGEALTLDKAIEIAQSYEYSQQQLKQVAADPNKNVQAVSRGKTGNFRKLYQNVQNNTGGARPKEDKRPKDRHDNRDHCHDNRDSRNKERKACGRCGRNHRKTDKCPALGEICVKCKKANHFAIMCKSKNVHDVESDMSHVVLDQDSDSDFFLDSVDTCHKLINDQAFVHVKLENVHVSTSHGVKFKVDTGSQVNILPESLYEKYFGSHYDLKKSDLNLYAYNGHTLSPSGCVTISCTHSNVVTDLEFQIIDTKSHPILGLRACLDLNLVRLTYNVEMSNTEHLTKEKLLKDHESVFTGIGLLSGECNIQTDPNVIPVVHPPRKVPLALKDKLQEELCNMENQGIICKVSEPTKWVNSLVVVEKPHSGKLRICLDPRDLNEAIIRPHYPGKTLDEVLPQLSNAKYFTKLDARSGYWTIKLSEASSYLTTFNTPFGRYRFLRLPFGLKSSQDEFQRKMDEVFEGLPGVVTLVDDILVFGHTLEEHNRNLTTALKRALEKGLKLNKEKLEVGVNKVKYFGHVLTDKGLEPDPEKVTAIIKMEAPQSKSELETVLGMITYLSRFAPNLADLTSPMRSLLSKNAEFIWDSAQQQAFDKVKEVITTSPVLAYFDPSKPTTLQVDASQKGLGATLLQEGRPIAFASKSLTPSEQNYAQIEKEMYGILFGCKHFHQYLYGREVKVETDHKPLVPIMKKPLHSAPPRLQRMLMYLQKYHLDVHFVPGKLIPVADTLSRKSLPETYPELSKHMEAHVHTVLAHHGVSDRRLDKIISATAQNKQFQSLRKVIYQGWPNERNSCAPEVLEYWNHRDELTYAEGLILKGQKVVIPHDQRPEILKLIHTGHQGIEKCLRRARSSVFWPGMNSDITKLVSACSICQEHRNSNPKEPMLPSITPDYPWQIVATDLFSLEGKEHLIVVDYYSRYFEVLDLTSTQSKVIIQKLKSIFARFGIPEKVVSDNGPQYSSSEFAAFAQEYNFVHSTSSPHYAQSNGLAERCVQTAKRILKKAKLDHQDPYLALLAYRSTPLDIGYSPAELLQGRNIRTPLPTLPSQLFPRKVNPVKVKVKLAKGRKLQKSYYDKGSHTLRPLAKGDYVRFQLTNKLWKPAVVIDKADDMSRSYFVRSSDGGIYRRNRRYINHTGETKAPEPDFIGPPSDATYSSSPNLHNTPQPLTVVDKGQNCAPEPHDLPVSPDKVTASPTKVTTSPAKVIAPPQPYITRSGRTVKPKVIPSY